MLRKYVLENFLFDGMLVLALYSILELVLGIFGWTLRTVPSILMILLSVIGLFVGVIQLLLKIRRNQIRVIAITTFMLASIATCVTIMPLALFL